MIDISKLEELFNKQIKLEPGEYGRKVTLNELITLSKNGDKVAKKFLEETLICYKDYFNSLEYALNDIINRQKNKIQKEEEERQQKYEKYMQEEAKRKKADAKKDAEQVIFKTENAIKTLGDKVSDKDKKEAEELIDDLKKEIETNDVEKINAAIDKLLEKANELSKRVSEEIRKTEEKRLKEIEKVKKAKEKELKKQKESKLMKNILIESKDSIKQKDREFIKYKNLYFEGIELPNQDFDLEKIISLSRKGNKEAKDIAGLALFKRAYKISKQFSYLNFDIEFEDLLQEAMIGLNDFITDNKYEKKRDNNEVLEIVENYDELTAFDKTIICAITDGIKYSSQYGIDNKELIEMLLYRRISELLLQQLGRKPTNNEISWEICKPIESVNYANKLAEPTVSINNISEEELTLRSPDYDISDTNTEEKVMIKIEYEIIYQILEEIKVPEHDKEIFMKLYIEDLTLEEAGKEFDISRERVRQIKAKVLRKIRRLFEKQKYKYKRDYRPLLVKKLDYYDGINGVMRPIYKYEYGFPYKTIDPEDIKKRIKTNRSYHIDKKQ